MRRTLKLVAVLAVLFALGLVSYQFIGPHKGHSVHGMMLNHSWSRPLPPVTANGAAYLTIQNASGKDDRLVGGSSDIAERIELHTHKEQGGVMKMVHLEGGVAIPDGEKMEFKPGHHHVMLIGLTRPLVEGESYDLTLHFEQAGELTTTVSIQEKPVEGHAH